MVVIIMMVILMGDDLADAHIHGNCNCQLMVVVMMVGKGK